MFVKVQDYNVYYEVHGEGKPLILLNGIMMSHFSWHQYLKELKGYQVVLIDFLDQGKSSKGSIPYTHEIQVEIVRRVVEELGLKAIHIMGISYGAQVALQYAMKYQVHKLLVFNGALSTTPWLNDIGMAWRKAAETYSAELFFHVTIPYIYSHRFYNENYEWVEARKAQLLQVFNSDFLDSMQRLIMSSENYDIIDTVGEIECETCVVGSEFDYLTPCDETKKIADCIPGAIFYRLEDCGHASVYEKPERFMKILKEFIN